MRLLLATAVLLSSETARSVLQDMFAAGTMIFAENFELAVASVLFIALALTLVGFKKRAISSTPGILRVSGSGAADLAATPSLLSVNKHVKDTGARSEIYTKLHATGGGSVENRMDNCQEMVNQYYDMATDFYEFGWGESFHFAPRHVGESFKESLARHEYKLALKMGLKEGDKVMDLGCGVGGPMRNIARFSGCQVVGINNNAYQVARGTAKNAALGLAGQCSLIKGDFMNLPFEPASFDHAYAIEATCHAPDRTACFTQIFNALKPGGHFCVYEWVSTHKYDASNPKHHAILSGIEVGNGLPTITGPEGVTDALRNAGFEVEEVDDMAVPPAAPHIKWYAPLEAKWNLSNFKCTKLGIWLTSVAVTVMETLHLAPKGTATMHKHLCTGAETLVESGQLEIFTPMLFVKATKPLA